MPASSSWFLPVLTVRLAAAEQAGAEPAAPTAAPAVAAPARRGVPASPRAEPPARREPRREMVTDRPDTTESPITVEGGHVQIEMDALAGERDEGATELWVATTNLRVGLARALDVHVIVEPWRRAQGSSGFGDLTTRAKLNLWGNDGGPTAFGVIGFVRLPTASAGLGAGGVEAGLIFPFTVELPGELELSSMIELDRSRREGGYGTDVLVTGSLARDLWGDLGGFVELVSSVSLDGPEEAELGANAGLILQLGDDLAVDGGARVGLSEAAPDLGWFIGGSARY